MRASYTPGKDFRQDRIYFYRHLPTTPLEGVDLGDYARRWGVTNEYMLKVLKSIGNVKRTNGFINPRTGYLGYNAWYREESVQ
jgi:hypothetical protein